MRIVQTLALALFLLLAGCGGGGGAGPAGTAATGLPASCSLADQKTWLNAYMRDEYLWFDQVGAGNPSASTIDAYFRSLLVPALDRFSFTQTAAEFAQFYEDGTRTGYGYGLQFSNGNTVLRVRSVEPGSPVDLAGLKRGDTIVTIDGNTPQQIAAGALPRVTTAGVPRIFVTVDASGTQRTLTVVSATFALVPVQADQVLSIATATGTQKVGYLSYGEFVASGNPGLARAFSKFTDQGATDLVLDLRYNGGGDVGVSQMLASMIGGSRVTGQTYTQLRFNARHPEKNETIPFISNAAELPAAPLQGLQRVFVITSAGTASASELVINSLKPFMQVVLIGGTTFGKPYGFEPVEACGTVFNAVNFEAVNALGVGGYSAGLAPTCAVPDDLDHALGDPAERQLAAALHYVAQGTCPPSAGLPLAAPKAQPLPLPGIDESGPGRMRR